MTEQDPLDVSALLAGAVERTPGHALGRLSHVEYLWLPVLLPLLTVFAAVLGWSGILSAPDRPSPRPPGGEPSIMFLDGLPATVVVGRTYELSFLVRFPPGWPGPDWPGTSATFDVDGYDAAPAHEWIEHYCMKVVPDVAGRTVTVTCPMVAPGPGRFGVQITVYTPSRDNYEREWNTFYLHVARPSP